MALGDFAASAARRRRAYGGAGDILMTPELEASLVSRVGSRAVGGIAGAANVQDVPGSVVRDFATWLPGGPAPANPFDQLLPWNWTKPTGRTTGRDLLIGYGLQSARKGLSREAAGVGLEIGLDPFTYLTFGGAALTRAGRLIKNAGVMDDIPAIAARKAGQAAGTIGKRQARTSTTLDDVLKYASPQQRNNLMDAARHQGVNIDTIKNDKLGGNIGFGFPFADPIGVLGTGARGQQFAKRVDDVFGGIQRWNVPGTDFQPFNSLRRALDARVMGAQTRIGQAMGQQLFDRQTVGRWEQRAKVADMVTQLEDMGLDDDKYADALLFAFESGDTSRLPQQAQQLVSQVRNELDRMPDIAAEYGVQLRQYVDPKSRYFPRFITEGKHPGRKGDGLYWSSYDPSKMGRLSFLHGIDGGTVTSRTALRDADLRQLVVDKAEPSLIQDRLKELFGDTASEKYLQGFTSSRRNPGVIPDLKSLVRNHVDNKQLKADLLEALDQTYAEGAVDVVKRYAPHLINEVDQIAAKYTRDRFADMADWVKGLSEETLEAGVFGNHPLADLQARLLTFNDSILAADSFIETLAQPSVLRMGEDAEGIKLSQLLEDANLSEGNLKRGAIRKLMQKMGVDTSAMKPEEVQGMFDELLDARVDPELASDMVRMQKAFTSPDEIAEMFGPLQSVTNFMKASFTSPFIAFHVRNLLSGQFQNWIKGMWSARSFRNAFSAMQGQTVEGAANIPVIQDIWRQRQARRGGGSSPFPSELSPDPNVPTVMQGEFPVYHGTPHDFTPEKLVRMPDGSQEYMSMDAAIPDGAEEIAKFPMGRFDIGKIGSGEGAQAYGYGLYFAGSRKVAEWYRNSLMQHQPEYKYTGDASFSDAASEIIRRMRWGYPGMSVADEIKHARKEIRDDVSSWQAKLLSSKQDVKQAFRRNGIEARFDRDGRLLNGEDYLKAIGSPSASLLDQYETHRLNLGSFTQMKREIDGLRPGDFHREEAWNYIGKDASLRDVGRHVADLIYLRDVGSPSKAIKRALQKSESTGARYIEEINELRKAISAAELKGRYTEHGNFMPEDPDSLSDSLKFLVGKHNQEIQKYLAQKRVHTKLSKLKPEDFKGGGRLYTAEIGPPEEEFLLYDKPLSQQPEPVKEMLLSADPELFPESFKNILRHGLEETKRKGKELETKINALGARMEDLARSGAHKGNSAEYRDIDKQLSSLLEEAHKYGSVHHDFVSLRVKIHGLEPDGKAIYRDLAEHLRKQHADTGGGRLRGDQLASEQLRNIGIRGIKYLDGASRRRGKGNYNYVLFDDADVDIVEAEAQKWSIKPDKTLENKIFDGIGNKEINEWTPEEINRIADPKNFATISEGHSKLNSQLETLVKSGAILKEDAAIARLIFSQSSAWGLPDDMIGRRVLKDPAGRPIRSAVGLATAWEEGGRSRYRVQLLSPGRRGNMYDAGASDQGLSVLLHEMGHIMWFKAIREGDATMRKAVLEFQEAARESGTQSFLDEFRSIGMPENVARHTAGIGPKSGVDPTVEQFAEYFAQSVMRRRIPHRPLAHYNTNETECQRTMLHRLRSATGIKPTMRQRLDELVDQLGGFNSPPDISRIRSGAGAAPVGNPLDAVGGGRGAGAGAAPVPPAGSGGVGGVTPPPGFEDILNPPGRPGATAGAGGGRQLTDFEATRILMELAYAHQIVSRHQGEAGNIVGNAARRQSGSLANIQSQAPSPARPDSGFSFTDAGKTYVGLDPETTWNPKAIRGVGGEVESRFAPMAGGEKFGYWTEGMNRLEPFIELLRRGVDPAEASRRVLDAQVPYSNRYYTRFERDGASLVFPFWKFSKHMVPATLRELAERPGGRLGQTLRTLNSLRESDATTPDYVSETASIPLNGAPLIGNAPEGTQRYLAGLGLMFEDPLSFLGGGVQGGIMEALGRMNPVLKAPLEWGTQEVFFQKGPRGGREMEDADPNIGRMLSNIAQTLEEPGAFLTGRTTERVDPVTWPGSEAMEHILANTPLARLLTTARTAVDPRKGAGAKAANLLTGLRVTDVSPEASEAIVRERAAEVMRDLGSRTFERTYFPQDRLDRLSPEQQLEVLQLQALMNTLARRAKERAEAAK